LVKRILDKDMFNVQFIEESIIAIINIKRIDRVVHGD
jgi:hypothetical protein